MSDSESGWWQTEDNDDVATAPKLWRPLRDAIGGFDLDPAAGCEPTPIAENRYTEADDGLRQPWFGNIWLNPPFSDKTPWFERLVTQYEHGDVDRAVALSTVDPSAMWFHDYFSTADVICYHEERDLYLGHGDSPSFSTMIGVWNPNADLIDALARMGTLVTPRDTDGTEQTTLFD
jgi:hypothetical protein